MSLDELDRKVLSLFPGKVVRKDLAGPLKGHLNVPAYVLEYLLGKYCSSGDADIIEQGLEEVKRVLSENYVHPDKSELVKSKIRELGRYRTIDKVKARLSETEDKYWAELMNLQLNHVNIGEELISKCEKLLAGGIWAIVDLTYQSDLFQKGVLRPFVIEQLRPIQLAVTSLEDVAQNRQHFTREEWIDLLLRSMGLEPASFSHRLKLLLLCRLIPFVESNYNFVELGPRGTGKSYVYRELSPYSILVSGGETTVPSLFYSLVGRGRVGLVGIWDLVAFDEVAGLEKLSNAAAVQILKDYMESGSFSRGKEEIYAMASLVFVGNIDFDIENILRTSHLFISFPEQMQDPAFLDRFHAYIPGWEIPKMHPSFFGNHYGFVVDYLAEYLRELRKVTYATAIDEHFRLGQALTKRDEKAIRRTVSGLLKLIHPDGHFTKEELEEYLQLALELRRRVREQLKKMGGMEYWNTNFAYTDLASKEERAVTVPEQTLAGPVLLPQEPRIGEAIGLAITQSYGTLQRFEVIATQGNGRLIPLGSMMRVMRESLKAAYEYIVHNHRSLGIDPSFKRDYDISVLATQMGVPKEGPSAGITILTAIVSALTRKPVRNDAAMTGEITLFGRVLPVGGVQEKVSAAMEAGIKKVYIPLGNAKDIELLPTEIKGKLEVRLVSNVVEVLSDAILEYRRPQAPPERVEESPKAPPEKIQKKPETEPLEKTELVPEETTVFIDGSNVARHNVVGEQKPAFRNILLAHEYYKGKGYKDIKVICDASLRHTIDIGRERFDAELRRSAWLRQAPAGVRADVAILRLAAGLPKSIVVSNDGFSKPEDIAAWPEINENRHRFKKFYIEYSRFLEL